MENINEDIRKIAETVDGMEFINISTEGRDMVLLRAIEMPEFAFAVLATEKVGSYSQMAFNTSDGGTSAKYSVLCACCYMSSDDETGMKHKFRDVIENTCRENGIHTVFVRRCGNWSGMYGDIQGIRIAEASKHRSLMQGFYTEKFIREKLQFISCENSKGMWS